MEALDLSVLAPKRERERHRGAAVRTLESSTGGDLSEPWVLNLLLSRSLLVH